MPINTDNLCKQTAIDAWPTLESTPLDHDLLPYIVITAAAVTSAQTNYASSCPELCLRTVRHVNNSTGVNLPTRSQYLPITEKLLLKFA